MIQHSTTERVTMDLEIEAFIQPIVGKPSKAISMVDNASFHRSKKLTVELAEWGRPGVGSCYLPTSFLPELNLIEILWLKIKYE